jgi:hypothetical protein
MKRLTITFMLIISSLSANEFVARVIYSEAGPTCTPKERYYVASVIKNRVNHRGFMNKKSMLEVVKVPNAFECIEHKQNQNWAISGAIQDHLKHRSIKNTWIHASILAKGNFKPKENIHFFLTKGTPVPKGFVAEKYWILTKAFSTKHFDFYTIKERK